MPALNRRARVTVNRPRRASGLPVVRLAVFRKAEMQRRPLRHAAAPFRRSVASLKLEPLKLAAVTPIACTRC
jgi:hypothetical protein